MNYWYIARANELFLDIDNAARSLKHVKARLQGAIECGKLDVRRVVVRESKRKGHIHVMVTLNHELEPIDRFVWEVILHSDIYRGMCNIMRHLYNVTSPGIFISPHPDFNETLDEHLVRHIRYPDGDCQCKKKHNAEQMKVCQAAKMFRGEYRAIGFFGKPSKNPCTVWPEL